MEFEQKVFIFLNEKLLKSMRGTILVKLFVKTAFLGKYFEVIAALGKYFEALPFFELSETNCFRFKIKVSIKSVLGNPQDTFSLL